MKEDWLRIAEVTTAWCCPVWIRFFFLFSLGSIFGLSSLMKNKEKEKEKEKEEEGRGVTIREEKEERRERSGSTGSEERPALRRLRSLSISNLKKKLNHDAKDTLPAAEIPAPAEGMFCFFCGLIICFLFDCRKAEIKAAIEREIRPQ
jgi:hypothetical protein